MIYQELIKYLSPLHLKKNESLKNHTSFKIGGPADIFMFPHSIAELQKMIELLKKLEYRYMILGAGNNCLFPDDGYRGALISTEKLNQIFISENIIQADCGVSLKELCDFSLNNSLSGLEFACGIPGSVGGAVFMNAGAYGGEMKDVVISVDYLDHNNEIKTHDSFSHIFSYRNSLYQQKNYFVLSVKVKLITKDKTLIKAQMDELQSQRKSKQPLEFPSAGSVFRRPEGHFVGKLIDDCGLRGYSIGGAQISEKHSGFIINKNNASAKDVKRLISYIQERVKCNFGVDLHTEIRIIEN